MKLLIIGATGTVGRELTRLATSEGHQVVAISRNQVLLEMLTFQHGCEALQLDLLSGTTLPQADALVDLSWPNRRLPRQVVRAAAGAVEAVDSWLGCNPGAVAVHAGTYVVAGAIRPAPPSLLTRLVWDDPYSLAKSAGERSVARTQHRERISVVRLGNVLTNDSMWGMLILRCVAYGIVANPEVLGAAANLTSVRPLLQAIEKPGSLVSTTAAAGVTWLDAITKTAAMTGRSFSADEMPTAVPRVDGSRNLARFARKALWIAPAALSNVPPWQIWPLLAPARLVQRLVMSGAPAGSEVPPALPIIPPMPGGRTDLTEIEDVLTSLGRSYQARGWAPPELTPHVSQLDNGGER